MNSFGRIFRIEIFGESHGKIIGLTIDGCPPGLDICEKDFEEDILRRKSGNIGTTQRIEPDKPELISGIFNGKTTGTPITIIFKNTNTNPKDYEVFQYIYRPGHADFTASKKYQGFNDYRGGGHFSGRLTLCIVAAGVIAKKIIKPITISASLIEVGASKNIKKTILETTKSGDSIGGIIECIVKNIPIGLGEPYFDSMESLISHIVFSIPGIKGIEFGSGFESAKMKGSEHNDLFVNEDGKTKTNNSGGINGGISNGNPILFKVAVKPTPSIDKIQYTFNFKTGRMEKFKTKGRHDTCFALRLPVVIEASTSIVIADLLLLLNKKFGNVNFVSDF